MAQPFDWMESKRSAEVVRTQRGRRETMYRTELEERAALLQRLGHSQASTRTRLRANLAWDFERGDSPLSAAQVDSIVERAFLGAGGGGGGAVPRPAAAPRAKGGTR